MNIAYYTRTLAAAFLNLHRAALERVADAAAKAESKAHRHVMEGVDQVAVVEMTLTEVRADLQARRRDLDTAIRKADAVEAAVQAELALLPYKGNQS